MYRHVSSGYDGESTYQFIPCKHGVCINQYGMDFNFCPYCGAEVGDEMDCRPRGFPAWAWNRGMRTWDDVPKFPEHPLEDYWELHSRYIRPDDYTEVRDVYDHFKWTPEHVRDKSSMLGIIREKQKEGGIFWVEEFRIVLTNKSDEIKRVLQKPEWKVKVRNDDSV